MMLRIITNDLTSKKRCENMYAMLCREFKKEPLSFTIEFCSDMAERAAEIYKDDTDWIEAVKNTRETLSAGDGYCCYPYGVLLPAHPLDCDSRISTLIHEIIHYYDYRDYCKVRCHDNYHTMMRDSNFSAFRSWTEYNAKKNEISLVFRLTYINSTMNNDAINAQAIGLLNQILPQYCTRYTNAKGTNDRLYATTHFLGMIDSLDKCTNSYVSFAGNFPMNIIDTEMQGMICEMHSCLKDMGSFPEANRLFEEFQRIINRFFSDK